MAHLPGRKIVPFDLLMGVPSLIYRAAKDLDQDPQPGTTCLMGNRVVMHYGMRRRQAFYESLSSFDELLAAAQRNALLSLGGAPRWMMDHIQIAFRIFDSAYSAPMGVLPMPKPGEPSPGLHAVAIYGYDLTTDSLIFQNSWGAGWGDKGMGKISRQYLEKHWSEAWLFRNARFGPTFWTVKHFEAASTAPEYYRAWRPENPRHIFQSSVSGLPVRTHIYEALSFGEDCRAQVVDLRDAEGLRRLGWAFLAHLRGEQEGTTLATEFFVFPPYRRLGLGTYMVGLSEELARRAGAKRLDVRFHAHDALPQVRGAGRNFLQGAGFGLRWRTEARPPSIAMAEKAI